MNDREKSDPGIVAVKPANKPGQPGAEPVEPRPGTKGNANRQSTLRTQGRARVTGAGHPMPTLQSTNELSHHRLRGSCHCGNIRIAIDWPDPYPRPTIPVRACGCGFCKKHRAAWTSHPNGRFYLRITDASRVTSYRPRISTCRRADRDMHDGGKSIRRGQRHYHRRRGKFAACPDSHRLRGRDNGGAACTTPPQLDAGGGWTRQRKLTRRSAACEEGALERLTGRLSM